jgi:hypothetical protein
MTTHQATTDVARARIALAHAEKRQQTVQSQCQHTWGVSEKLRYYAWAPHGGFYGTRTCRECNKVEEWFRFDHPLCANCHTQLDASNNRYTLELLQLVTQSANNGVHGMTPLPYFCDACSTGVLYWKNLR